MTGDWYLWIKALHILAVIAWMAGLFYLPRLYVYHVERGQTPEPNASFMIMEEKLLKVIMTPAMVASWFAGATLASIPGVVAWDMIWPWLKLGSIVGMTWFHIWLAARRNDFLTGRNTLSGRRYRLMNEVPTVLMVVIVVSVVVKF